MKTTKKIKDIYRKHGFKLLLIRGFKKLANYLFQTNSAIWFEKDLSLPLIDITPKLAVEAHLLSKDETIDWLKTKGESWMFDELEISVGLARNHYFPNLKYEGLIIGYAKVGMGMVYIRDYKQTINFPERVSIIYDLFISSDYRGFNVAPFFVLEIMKFLKSRNFNRVIGYTPKWNIASIILHKKLGYKMKKTIRFIRIFNYTFLSDSPIDL
jgi:RimJ/RimL family protein N-acetyltransferase